MIIKRSTTLHVNMGNYEFAELRAEVELDSIDFDSEAELMQEATRLLGAALEADIIEARETTALVKGESFIHNWKE